MNDYLHHALVALRDSATNGGARALVPEEAAALLAEVERLRAEAHELRMMVEEAARAENANAEDAKRERAAVVAWLNAEAERVDCGHIEDLADRIERGEHRREEKP